MEFIKHLKMFLIFGFNIFVSLICMFGDRSNCVSTTLTVNKYKTRLDDILSQNPKHPRHWLFDVTHVETIVEQTTWRTR